MKPLLGLKDRKFTYARDRGIFKKQDAWVHGLWPKGYCSNQFPDEYPCQRQVIPSKMTLYRFLKNVKIQAVRYRRMQSCRTITSTWQSLRYPCSTFVIQAFSKKRQLDQNEEDIKSYKPALLSPSQVFRSLIAELDIWNDCGFLTDISERKENLPTKSRCLWRAWLIYTIIIDPAQRANGSQSNHCAVHNGSWAAKHEFW